MLIKCEKGTMKLTDVMHRSTLKQLIAVDTGHGQVQKFAKWAFGRTINQDFMITEMSTYWNHRHADKLNIQPGTEDIKTVESMIAIWRESQIPVFRSQSLTNVRRGFRNN